MIPPRKNRGTSIRVDDEFAEFLNDFTKEVSVSLGFPVSQKKASKLLADKLNQKGFKKKGSNAFHYKDSGSWFE